MFGRLDQYRDGLDDDYRNETEFELLLKELRNPIHCCDDTCCCCRRNTGNCDSIDDVCQGNESSSLLLPVYSVSTNANVHNTTSTQGRIPVMGDDDRGMKIDNVTTQISLLSVSATSSSPSISSSSLVPPIPVSSIHSTSTSLSTIKFLSNPLLGDDTAAGALGDALQIQLQNVLNYNRHHQQNHHHQNKHQHKEPTVVKNLYLVIQHLSVNTTNCKYQSLLDYIGNRNIPSYLESITIDVIGDFCNPLEYTDIVRIQQVLIHFLLLIQTNRTLQKLSIVGSRRVPIPIPVFVQFLNHCSIQIFEWDSFTIFTSANIDTDYVCNNDHDQLVNAFCNNRTIRELCFQVGYMTYGMRLIDSVLRQLHCNSTVRCIRCQWEETYDDMVSNEFINNLSQLVSLTNTLYHLELNDFVFERFTQIETLLNALLLSNTSIKILSLQNCRYNEYQWSILSNYIPRLSRIEQLHITFDRIINPRMFDDILYTILPSNGTIRQLHLLPKQRIGGGGRETLSLHQQQCIQSYTNRNCGIHRFLQQYVQSNNNNNNDENVASNNESNCDSNTTIPIELIPTIISQHISSCYYGPTWIYQTISNLGNSIGTSTKEQ